MNASAAAPLNAHTSTDELVSSLRARRDYQAAYAKWLHAAANLADESTGGDEIFDQLCSAEEDAASQFLAMRPPLRWLIWRKFELLEHVLAKEDRAGVRDREREMQALAAIRADLLYLGFDR